MPPHRTAPLPRRVRTHPHQKGKRIICPGLTASGRQCGMLLSRNADARDHLLTHPGLVENGSWKGWYVVAKLQYKDDRDIMTLDVASLRSCEFCALYTIQQVNIDSHMLKKHQSSVPVCDVPGDPTSLAGSSASSPQASRTSDDRRKDISSVKGPTIVQRSSTTATLSLLPVEPSHFLDIYDSPPDPSEDCFPLQTWLPLDDQGTRRDTTHNELYSVGIEDPDEDNVPRSFGSAFSFSPAPSFSSFPQDTITASSAPRENQSFDYPAQTQLHDPCGSTTGCYEYDPGPSLQGNPSPSAQLRLGPLQQHRPLPGDDVFVPSQREQSSQSSDGTEMDAFGNLTGRSRPYQGAPRHLTSALTEDIHSLLI